jgi:lysozyme family protein
VPEWTFKRLDEQTGQEDWTSRKDTTMPTAVSTKPVPDQPAGTFEFAVETVHASGTDLARALAFTLSWEGGYVNDPVDPGGATNKGVIQRTYDTYSKRKGLQLRPVLSISDEEVQDIYKSMYWDAIDGDQKPWPLNAVLFDTAVNMGPGRARAFEAQAHEHLDQDPTNDPLELARMILDLRVNWYYARVKSKPAMNKFLRGWLNRVRDLKSTIGY